MFTWITEDADGKQVSTSQEFASRDEAEAWMGSQWSSLASGGGRMVVLMEDAQVVYRMSLDPE